MSMNIKSPEAHELAKELASLEHTTVTEAVTVSLREALARRRAESAAATKLARMRAISTRFAAELAKTPGPSLWQINAEMYDELGLPK